MAKTALWIVLATVGLSGLSGCGTIFNFSGNIDADGTCQIYGGVRNDVQGAPVFFASAGSLTGLPATVEKLLGACYLVVDVPLCALADTVTLPWTVAYQLGKSSPDSGPSTAATHP